MCDTKRVDFVYEGETIFDIMQEDLIKPKLKSHETYYMMRTQMDFFYIVRDELIERYPTLKAESPGILEQVMNAIRKKPADHVENTMYKNIDLESPAHQLICLELEKRNIMFIYEANTVLPGYTKQFRRIDLVVVQNHRAVIVEIDGKKHRESQKQYQDDMNCDRLVGNHWNNQLRLEYGEVMDDFRDNEGKHIMNKILSRLNPSVGSIR